MKWEYWIVSDTGQIIDQYTKLSDAKLKARQSRYWRIFKCRILRKT